MNADGSSQTNLTNSPSANELGPPSWSPDGSRLAYSISHDGIYVSNAGGGGAMRLTTNPDGDVEPAWSPDGSQIVFSRQYQGSCTAPPGPSAGGQCRQLWIVNADGSGLRQLTDNPGGGDASPSWGSAPLVVPPPAEDVIAHEQAAAPISAYGGRLAWSSYDPQTKRYSLVTWLPGLSEPQTLAVKPRSVAFDVDLGPDAHGHTVAVYSRCRREQSPGAVGTSRGCDLYLYDFISRHETRIRSTSTPGGSEFLPTIWGSRIAFARNWEQRKGRAGRVSYIYTRPLTRRGRSTRLAGGPFGEGGPGPTSLDLRGKRLAMTWGWFVKHGREQWSRVQLDTIGGPTKRVAQAVSINTIGATLLSASLASDGVYWVARGDTALKAPELVDSFRRYDLRGGAITAAAAPSGVASAARDSGRVFYLRGTPPADYVVGRVVPEFAPLPAIP